MLTFQQDQAIVIAAGMASKPVFAAPLDKKVQSYAHKLLWANKTFSDSLALLNAYEAWKQRKDSRFFDRRNDGRDCKRDFFYQLLPSVVFRRNPWNCDLGNLTKEKNSA